MANNASVTTSMPLPVTDPVTAWRSVSGVPAVVRMLVVFQQFAPSATEPRPAPVRAMLATMSIEVIGSGFGRTGTATLKRALQHLGFDPCYHMEEVLPRPWHMRAWGRYRPGNPDGAVDFARLLRNYRATVDFPAAFAYRDLLATFPEAKVVHTVRDPDDWWESTMATIYPARRVMATFPRSVIPGVRALYRTMDAVLWDGLFDGHFSDRAHAIDVFERWSADVVATVPPERLLVYEVADGWAPLCAFLGVPVPDRPFPAVNDRRTFRRRLTAIRVAPLAVVISVAGAWVWRRRRAPHRLSVEA